MITYSVQSIGQLGENLRRKGITIVDDIKEYGGIGKIVHIFDCDGNYCELWEIMGNYNWCIGILWKIRPGQSIISHITWETLGKSYR